MKAIFAAVFTASLALLALSGPARAQAPGGAEARVKSLNITLPADAAPAANFVNSVQTGKLLFLSGNTAGPAWVGKGKLGKDLTVEQGREAARQAGLIMLTRSAPHSAASIGSSAWSRCLAWSTRPKVSATSRSWSTDFPISWWKCLVRPANMRARPSAWRGFPAIRRSRWK